MTPIDFTPIYCAFYTAGTFYEREAQRLRESLERLGLPHDIRGIDSRGDWAANASYTATFCVEMLEKHFYRPVVYLDADAVVRQFPRLFYETDADIAAHWVNGQRFANGTVYFGKGPIAASIARRYRSLVNGRHLDEQRLLEQAISEHAPGAKVERLPSSYCYIGDIHREKLADEQIVVQHFQASRQAKGDVARLKSRESMIAQAECWMKHDL